MIFKNVCIPVISLFWYEKVVVISDRDSLIFLL